MGMKERNNARFFFVDGWEKRGRWVEKNIAIDSFYKGIKFLQVTRISSI